MRSWFSVQMTTTPEQVKDFMSGTLLCVQEEQLCAERSLWDRVQDSLVLLQEKDLITVTRGSQGDTLEITTLGRATYKSEWEEPHRATRCFDSLASHVEVFGSGQRSLEFV